METYKSFTTGVGSTRDNQPGLEGKANLSMSSPYAIFRLILNYNRYHSYDINYDAIWTTGRQKVGYICANPERNAHRSLLVVRQEGLTIKPHTHQPEICIMFRVKCSHQQCKCHYDPLEFSGFIELIRPTYCTPSFGVHTCVVYLHIEY